MARQHHCKGEWVDGSVDSCPNHGPRGRNALRVRYGRNARRKMDRQAGTVGVDRGDYING